MVRPLSLLGIMLAALCPLALDAQTAPPRINACTLTTKAEVRKHLPWIAALDGMPVDEEPVGTAGSSCNYPTVHIQVLPLSQESLARLRKRESIEVLQGLGDEAFFYNNRGQYAELYIRVGQRLLTLQADVEDNLTTIKPAAINLAKVLVAKLR